MKMRLSISAVIAAFGLMLALGFGAVVLTSAYALRELKVGGALYSKIKLGNDLVADILPPPEYVLEAYLEATLALRNPKNVDAHVKKLEQLKKDYEDRKTFWSGSALEPELKTLLVEQSDGEVRRFWQAAEAELIPALRAGDTAKADAAYARLSEAYGAHRAVIDRLVEKANKLNSDIETIAAEQDRSISVVVWTVAGIVLVLVVAGLSGLVMGVVRPLSRMTGLMRRIAEGELAAEIPYAERGDEIGAMARALGVFKTNAIENNSLRDKQDRDRTEAEQTKKRAMLDMADVIERETGTSVESAATASRQVESVASGLSDLAHELSADAQSVAAASEQSLANAQTVSAAAEQLSSAIREISSQVARASTITKSAVTGREKAKTTMLSLTKAVDKIAEVSNLIGGIAEQTNLLALNATIEAARAGDAGRGFAVVAAEVKSLSDQTAKSTEEISRLIGEVQTTTQATIDVVEGIGSQISEIDEVAASIAAAMEEQHAATQEISRSVHSSASAARDVSSKIGNVGKDAGMVNDRAAEVRSAIGNVASSLTALRATLVKVVRTTTAEADRRHAPRFRSSLPIKVVDSSKGEVRADLVDISEGGAWFRLDPEPGIGDRGVLKFAGFDGDVPYQVRARDRDALRVEFDLGAKRESFVTWFRSSFMRQAA
ncbi:HAMP domain-containing protein [Bradyrhizobium sp. 83012]|uniref:HAMP domain-containing protein n=1 Tax=Bradyrhizobium aeschynomenes TaxID=2734909 RepID=A0ABX2CBT9_9BRAD|nr:methyl-accepting chemotaxis protein [Bradyrhizobium aeschynomenes]NPU65140.1 HAMP domain-containing protein [Bradyrhizobium aeschynomenes]